MPERKRNRQICLRFTDEEFSLFERKCKASGLSQTDFIMKSIRNSKVQILSIEDSIRPLIHEIRKIGTNLNQLAYFSNIGQDELVRAEIGNIRIATNKAMEELSDFLKNPKFDVKCLET